MSERIVIDANAKHLTVRSGQRLATIPLARIVRDDGQPRRHHPRCPTRPGELLGDHTICCDCIHGAHP